MIPIPRTEAPTVDGQSVHFVPAQVLIAPW